MIQLLSEEEDKKIFVKYLPQPGREYDLCIRGKNEISNTSTSSHQVVLMPDKKFLNQYWGENYFPRPEAFNHELELAHFLIDKKIMYRHLRAAAVSGWNFSSRWLKTKRFCYYSCYRNYFCRFKLPFIKS